IILSGIPLVVIESTEETRVIELLKALALALKMPLQGWTITRGLKRLDTDNTSITMKDAQEPKKLLHLIQENTRPSIYALFDFHVHLENDYYTQRLLKEVAIANSGQSSKSVIVLVGGEIQLPADIRRYVANFELILPNHEDLEKLVKQEAINWARANNGKRVQTDNMTLKRLVDNLRGLNYGDARRLVRKIIWDDGAITAEELPKLNKAKFELMDMAGVLSFEYETSHFSQVGGLNKLKSWVAQREKAFFQDNAAKSLEPPKGLMLVGVQGGGKSLASKAIAGIWGIPLLRLDFGALYNKYHGETEKNLREALKMASMMSPCVLWMDEVEKGVASSDSDGGTSRRVLGTLLTWMSENKEPVFVVATANDISALPPELIRKGRIDEIFFVDLPAEEIRETIFKIHLDKREIDSTLLELSQLAAASDGFSGAEIEQAIIGSIYRSVSNNRPVNQEMLLAELQETRPLSVVMAEQLTELRRWARERTVFAD
ncbi:MAG: ATPase, partial [Gammaproteobacteria bacterium CG22_combo_CG10-13_8_21_14_all_40_8]